MSISHVATKASRNLEVALTTIPAAAPADKLLSRPREDAGVDGVTSEGVGAVVLAEVGLANVGMESVI